MDVLFPAVANSCACLQTEHDLRVNSEASCKTLAGIMMRCDRMMVVLLPLYGALERPAHGAGPDTGTEEPKSLVGVLQRCQSMHKHVPQAVHVIIVEKLI